MVSSDLGPSPRPSPDSGDPVSRGRKRLPVKPSDEHLRKQAKRRAKRDRVSLADAQHALAQEYGCKHWAELMGVVAAMNSGADQLVNVQRDHRPLPVAVRERDLDGVGRILASGDFTPYDLDAGLAHAAWYGGDARDVLESRKAIFDLLIEHGADPDGQYGSDYGPIVFGAGECLSPEGLQWLLDAGADVTFAPVATKYGRQCAMSTWLGAYARGNNTAKHRGIELLLQHHAYVPPELHPAIFAIHRGDVDALSDLIDQDPSLPRRRFADMIYGNMRLDGATLLHCAVEFGELKCIDLLLDRWMEPNVQAEVINGIGGQTPIYHAIAAHNLPALEHFVKRLGYAIEGHRVRATFKVFDTVYDTPMTPIEYAEKMSGDDVPAWRRASARELELVRSTVWPGIQRKTEAEKTPTERLQEACRAGDFDAVKRVVESGEVPAEKLNLGIEGCAITKGEDIARYLIDHGADINADYIDNYGPVLLGFCEGLHDEEVEFVLKLSARADWSRRPSAKYPDHSTPLRMACETYVRGRNVAKHRILDLLIAAGAKPEDDALMAIHRGDAKKLGQMIDADPSLIRKDRQFEAMFDFADEPRRAKGTLLHIAVEHNEIACIDAILSRYRGWTDSDINTRAEMLDGLGGHTPLFLAAHSWLGAGYPTLRWLVDRVGQYIDTGIAGAVREDGKPVQKTVMEYAGSRERALLEPLDRRTQIRRAIEARDTATFTRMLDEHPELVSPGLWPTVIHRASSVEMTRILLDRRVDPNACPAPRKPLHLACDRGAIDIVRLLLDRGARIDVVDGENITPYELLCCGLASPGNAEELRQLLRDAGATDNVFTHIYLGHDAEAAALLRLTPSLAASRGPIGFTPLDTAARAARPAVVRALLDAAVPADSPNTAGNTPLWLACQSGADAARRLEVAAMLLDAGADPNRCCEDGSTPLHFAAWRGPVEMVELLLARGGDPAAKDHRGQTPAHFARESNASAQAEAILRVLETAGR